MSEEFWKAVDRAAAGRERLRQAEQYTEKLERELTAMAARCAAYEKALTLAWQVIITDNDSEDGASPVGLIERAQAAKKRAQSKPLPARAAAMAAVVEALTRILSLAGSPEMDKRERTAWDEAIVAGHDALAKLDGAA